MVSNIVSPIGKSFSLTGKGAVASLFISVGLWMFGNLMAALAFLLALCLIDFLSGLLKACKMGTLESSKIMPTIFKVTGYMLFVYMLNLVCIKGTEAFMYNASSENIASAVRYGMVISHLLIGVLALREMISVVENLASAGVLPDKFSTILSRIMVKVEDRAMAKVDSLALDNLEDVNNNKINEE